MDDREEVKFWKRIIKLVRKGYGKPCKEFAFGCSSCEANLAVAWMQKHIDLLKWGLKYPNNKKNFKKKQH